jgi:hypothetical protein
VGVTWARIDALDARALLKVMHDRVAAVAAAVLR